MTKTTNTYTFPVARSATNLQISTTSSGSHEGQYKGSVDFAVSLGTTVQAAAEGVVIRVQVTSERYGTTIDFGQDVNYITIKHANNELSEYLHLAKDSAMVKVGEIVKHGQPIAKTGLSGWLFAPHLHFMVFTEVAKPEDFHCLEIRFHSNST